MGYGVIANKFGIQYLYKLNCGILATEIEDAVHLATLEIEYFQASPIFFILISDSQSPTPCLTKFNALLLLMLMLYSCLDTSAEYYALGLESDDIGLGQVTGSSYRGVYVPDNGRLNNDLTWC